MSDIKQISIGNITYDLKDEKARIQVDTMPTATADNYGTVVQYIGASTNDYTHGYFYECTRAMGTQLYYWMNVPVSEGSGGGHTIFDNNGTSMTQRAGLQFEDMNVTDDSTNDRTKVKLPIFNGTTAQWNDLSSTEKAKYTVVNLTDDYGSQKIYEVTFEKGVDSFTHDTTNNRYTCQKTFGDSSVLRNIDEFEIRLEIHTISNTAMQVASENIKLSDQLSSTASSYYFGVTWISPIGGNINRFIYCQFSISKTGSGSVVADLFIGDTQYNVSDIIKFSLYRE